MQNEAEVPQKHRVRITNAIFNNEGVTNADDSILFDHKCKSVLKLAKNYPNFITYFTKNISSILKDYVVTPANEKNLVRNWTNNNCESLNHIMKLDAMWKPGKTSEMIELLHEMTLLHFRDYRRALYGGGNYRLVEEKKRRHGVSKDDWRQLNEAERSERFKKFLKNQNRKVDDIFVQSSYANFKVPKPTTAKKPGQRKRVRASKSSAKKVT